MNRTFWRSRSVTGKSTSSIQQFEIHIRGSEISTIQGESIKKANPCRAFQCDTIESISQFSQRESGGRQHSLNYKTSEFTLSKKKAGSGVGRKNQIEITLASSVN